MKEQNPFISEFFSTFQIVFLSQFRPINNNLNVEEIKQIIDILEIDKYDLKGLKKIKEEVVMFYAKLMGNMTSSKILEEKVAALNSIKFVIETIIENIEQKRF